MDICLALLLFSFIILLYWVITKLFTFIFRLTGLPVEKARFQVISLLTVFGDYRAICKAFHAREHFMDERTGGTPAEEKETF